MTIIIKSCFLVPAALGLIPKFYPDPRDWLEAVGKELINNRVLESVTTDVVDMWNNLGGPEMVQKCIQKGSPTTAFAGTLFLAGELAAVLKPPLPAAMHEDLEPICNSAPVLGLVNVASQLLYELRIARRDVRTPLTMEQVVKYTPLANIPLVCGRVGFLLGQVLIQSVVQRNLGTVQFDAPALPIENLTNFQAARHVIHHYSRNQLIAGGVVSTDVLNAYVERMFRDGGLFHEENGIFFVTGVKLDANDNFGSKKFYWAGRALALSLLYNVPIGRELDPNLVELLCCKSKKLEVKLLQDGFRNIIPKQVFQGLNIGSKTVGGILRGLAVHQVTRRDLQNHMRLDLEKFENAEFFNALGEWSEYTTLFIKFATGLRHMPVGGLYVIVPAITIRIDPTVNTASANHEDHSVTLPREDLGYKLIYALKSLGIPATTGLVSKYPSSGSYSNAFAPTLPPTKRYRD